MNRDLEQTELDCISRQALKDLGAECIAKRDENGNLIPLGCIDNLPSVSCSENPNRCEDAVRRVTYKVFGSSGRLYVPMGEYYKEEQAYRQIVKAGEKTNRQFQVYKITTKEELHNQLTAKEARRLIGGE